MTYQVLARKWRPKTFESLKGQSPVTTALINALTRQQIHHAYLFTGTRGVGKTSIARILAKALNCEKGISPTPCGVCDACVNIDQGTYIDLIEVDGASRTRVEDTRELLENVQYSPTQGRFKIYLIDEVHMLSTHSFNALLKTLEEPPAHVKFILATTDPDRIPMTILSRCLRLSLRALSPNEVMAQCAHILTQENISYEPPALRQLSLAANGSMRDALSLLEQAIAYGDGTVKASHVEDMLGMSFQRYLPELMRALSYHDVATCLATVEKIAAVAADFSQVLAALLQTFHALALTQAVGSETELAILDEIDPALLGFKDQFSPEEIQLLYQMALHGQRDLPYAPSARTAFEMTLLRMMVFYRQSNVQIKPIEMPKVIAKPIEKSVAAPVISAPVIPTAPPPAPRAPVAQPVVQQQAVVPQATTPEYMDWEILSNQLILSGFTKMIVKHCVVSQWDGQHLRLTLEPSQKACLNAPRQAQIQDALSQHFARPIKLTITVGEIQGETPLVKAQIAAREKADKSRQSVLEDTTVKQILSTFNATVEKITTHDNEEK